MLRFLQYVAKEYEKLFAGDLVYGRKRIMLPEPRFVVFYNGTEILPERMELRLSESFSGREGKSASADHVRVKKAIPLAVDQCIKEGILSDFLRKNKAEVVPMSIYEYNEEAVMAIIREQEFEFGLTEGLKRGRAEGEKKGEKRGRRESIALMIESCAEWGIDRREAALKIQEKFGLSESEVRKYIDRNWK